MLFVRVVSARAEAFWGLPGQQRREATDSSFTADSRPAAGVGFAFFIERESYTSITYIVSIRRWWGNLLKHPVVCGGCGVTSLKTPSFYGGCGVTSLKTPLSVEGVG